MTRQQTIVRLTRERRQRWRERLAKLKEQPCKDCGQTFPHYVMDYDHVGKKVKGLSKLINEAARWERIEAEIAKCDLVCANCHRIRTHNRLRARSETV